MDANVDTSRMKRDIHEMPKDVREALKAAKAMDAYRARPAYQQNDYVGWITRAKLPATREKRIQQMLEELAVGRRLHEDEVELGWPILPHGRRHSRFRRGVESIEPVEPRRDARAAPAPGSPDSGQLSTAIRDGTRSRWSSRSCARARCAAAASPRSAGRRWRHRARSSAAVRGWPHPRSPSPRPAPGTAAWRARHRRSARPRRPTTPVPRPYRPPSSPSSPLAAFMIASKACEGRAAQGSFGSLGGFCGSSRDTGSLDEQCDVELLAMRQRVAHRVVARPEQQRRAVGCQRPCNRSAASVVRHAT